MEVRFFNCSKGIIRSPDFRNVKESDMVDGLALYRAIAAYRINFKDEQEVSTNSFFITFATSLLPTEVRVGYIRVKVMLYAPNAFRCFKCQKYGHHSKHCRGKAACLKCGSVDHSESNRTNPLKCLNCDGDHSAAFQDCHR